MFRHWRPRLSASLAFEANRFTNVMKTQHLTREQTFSTERDSDLSFIDGLSAKAAYFDGGLKRYSSGDANNFSHLGDEYRPVYSMHTEHDCGEVTDVPLFALRKHGLPGLTVFGRTKPRPQSSALHASLVYLMNTRDNTNHHLPFASSDPERVSAPVLQAPGFFEKYCDYRH